MANVPREAISPHVGVDMQTLAAPAWPGALECVLRISLHARLAGKTIFMIEVSEAGVFELDLSNMEEAHRFVRKIAPSVLFPFARKDLASLAVAAGFQPVLLDHIDFDAMLTQVIKSQRLTRAPTPMRLDVIAAKPAAAPLDPVADKPALDWSDTQPSPLQGPEPKTHASQVAKVPLLAEQNRTPPQIVQPPNLKLPIEAAPKKKLRDKALALLGVATVGATIAWWMQPAPTSQADAPVATVTAIPVQAKVLAASATPASPPAIPAVPVATVPAEMLTAIEISRERLADQPAAWFTLDLGLAPAATPMASFYTPGTDRPLFVLAAKDASIRLLYGVFPSKAAAELVRKQLLQSEPSQGLQAATIVTIGSL